MEIIELNKRPDLIQNKKLRDRFFKFEKLINELKKREIPNELVGAINDEIEKVNAISSSDKILKNQLRKSQLHILKKIEKGLKLVVKNHYRNMWLGVGMALGVAIGSAIGTGTNNMSLFALGLPLGMALGIAYGTSLDKKAKEEGKQLDVELT